MAISKSDFVRALQCPKMMWLDKHKPEEKRIPPEVQQRLDGGNAFGDDAMGMFGEYVETTCYKEDGRLDYSKMIETTRTCLEEGVSVVCEAAFSFYGNYCAVDILRKREDGYEIYEVKNSSEIKEVFLQDIGFQKYLLKKCGVAVKRAYIVTNGGEETPYRINDVTRSIYPYERLAWDKVWEFSKIKSEKEEPKIDAGGQCESPYRCWYWDYCHGNR